MVATGVLILAVATGVVVGVVVAATGVVATGVVATGVVAVVAGTVIEVTSIGYINTGGFILHSLGRLKGLILITCRILDFVHTII